MPVYGKGLDIGTVNLISAMQTESGEVVLKKQRNAFLDMPMDIFAKNMLTQLKIPYAIHNKRLYVLGDHSFELANVLNRNVRRPMKEGMLSPKEVDAVPIMKLLIERILENPRKEKELCYYSIPAEPIDSDLNTVYHIDIFNAVLSNMGYTPKTMIEGHAVVLSELAEEEFTGIGISCGGGMMNVCVCYKALPCLSFSTSRAGDWIDENAARAVGIKVARLTFLKESGIDLLNPKSREEEATVIYYRNMINYTLNNIKEKFLVSENMPSFPEPVVITLSGGSTLAKNFEEVFRQEFEKIEFPIPVKAIKVSEDPLNAVARGVLLAAMSEESAEASEQV
jgi:actin-like ATPase involved in cell morphogenesis